MRIVIPGGSGQVGTVLARAFHGAGHDVVVLSRRPLVCPWRVLPWDGRTAGAWTDGVCAIQACDFDGMDVYCPSAEDKICEPQGDGTLSLCLERCDDPGGGSGPDHGCSRDDYACYPSALGDGSGVCYPACTITAFCRDFFHIEGANLCDNATGLCRL